MLHSHFKSQGARMGKYDPNPLVLNYIDFLHHGNVLAQFYDSTVLPSRPHFLGQMKTESTYANELLISVTTNKPVKPFFFLKHCHERLC